MVGEGGNNYLSVAPGANYRLTPERIDENRELIAESDWVLMQYEIARPTVERCSRSRARKARRSSSTSLLLASSPASDSHRSTRSS